MILKGYFLFCRFSYIGKLMEFFKFYLLGGIMVINFQSCGIKEGKEGNNEI